MKYVPDYFINVLDPYDMEDEEIDRMESNLREVMYVVKYSSDRERLFEKIESDKRFASLDLETKDFIEYYSKINICENETGGYNMCRAIQELKDERDNAVKEVSKVKAEADKVKVEADKAKAEADKVKAEADKAKAEADRAVKDAEKTIQEKDKIIADLQAQLAEEKRLE